MRNDRVFRVRMPSAEVAALKRVARERGQAASVGLDVGEGPRDPLPAVVEAD